MRAFEKTPSVDLGGCQYAAKMLNKANPNTALTFETLYSARTETQVFPN